MLHESQDAQGIYLSIAAWFLEIGLQLSLQSLFPVKLLLATHNSELPLCASGSGEEGGRVLQVQNSGGMPSRNCVKDFLNTWHSFTFSYIFKIKLSIYEEKA